MALFFFERLVCRHNEHTWGARKYASTLLQTPFCASTLCASTLCSCAGCQHSNLTKKKRARFQNSLTCCAINEGFGLSTDTQD